MWLLIKLLIVGKVVLNYMQVYVNVPWRSG